MSWAPFFRQHIELFDGQDIIVNTIEQLQLCEVHQGRDISKITSQALTMIIRFFGTINGERRLKSLTKFSENPGLAKQIIQILGETKATDEIAGFAAHPRLAAKLASNIRNHVKGEVRVSPMWELMICFWAGVSKAATGENQHTNFWEPKHWQNAVELRWILAYVTERNVPILSTRPFPEGRNAHGTLHRFIGVQFPHPRGDRPSIDIVTMPSSRQEL